MKSISIHILFNYWWSILKLDYNPNNHIYQFWTLLC